MNPLAEALMSEEEKKYLKVKEDILQTAKSFSNLSRSGRHNAQRNYMKQQRFLPCIK